ncbi:MAG TPA: DUF6587 family protein [Steroidobacteraceae bacterium]|jgi:hypothetical protein|nr:DUF6587 family protein [Steroidobacteraceae bacterium]
MNAILDDIIVGAVLFASIGYAVVKLGPKTLRKRILEASSRALNAAPKPFGLRGVAQRLERASAKAAAACGGCDSCGTESSSAPQSSGEVRVPVSKIGRRP